MSPNRTSIAILTLLRFAPMTGQDIRETFRTRMAQFWSESYGQIYPALKALETDGLIAPADPAPAQRGNVYEITPVGSAHLAGWLAQPPAARQVRDEMFLKLMCGSLGGDAVQRGHVERMRDETAERLANARAGLADLRTHAGGMPDFDYWMLVARAGELTAEAMLAWCEEALAVIEAREARHGQSED